MVAVLTGCLVSPPPLLPQNIQSHQESPESHRVQGVPPTINLTLGANREDKGKVKGKASRIQSSRIGSGLVCVRRNAHYRELKLPESTRFMLNTVLMVTVSPCGPTGVVLLPSRPKTYKYTKNITQAIGREVKHKPRVLRWAQIPRARGESRVKLAG